MSQHTDKGDPGEHKTTVCTKLHGTSTGKRIRSTPQWVFAGQTGFLCVLCVSVCGANALIMLISQFHLLAWWFPVGTKACHVPPNSREWVWKRKNWNTLLFSLRWFLTLYDQQQLFPALVTPCVARFHGSQTVIHLFRLIRWLWNLLWVHSAKRKVCLQVKTWNTKLPLTSEPICF